MRSAWKTHAQRTGRRRRSLDVAVNSSPTIKFKEEGGHWWRKILFCAIGSEEDRGIRRQRIRSCDDFIYFFFHYKFSFICSSIVQQLKVSGFLRGKLFRCCFASFIYLPFRHPAFDPPLLYFFFFYWIPRGWWCGGPAVHTHVPLSACLPFPYIK